MANQNMLRTYMSLKNNLKFVSALNLYKCLKQIK